MKQYEKYKATGIDWIGDIPNHWEIMKYRRLFSVSSGDMLSREIENHNEEGFPVYGGNGLRGFANEFNNEGPMLLLGRVGAKCGNVRIANDKFWVSEHALRIFPKMNFDLQYFKYLLELTNFNQFAITTAQPLINSDIVLDRYAAIPPIPEQTSIANYLDDKTTQIDKLITNKRKLIELLKEERTAFINEAVSGKGKNWERKKLKYVAKLKSGDGITADDIRLEGDYPVYGGNGLRGYTSKYTHEGEYVLIGRQGALCGNINYANGKFFASEHAVVVSILDKSEFIWLGELLRSMNLNQYSQASAQPGLSVEKIQNLIIPVPQPKEQTQIVHHIETETQRIDNTISKIEKEIELMREYRASLISEVVTGKIKVT